MKSSMHTMNMSENNKYDNTHDCTYHDMYDDKYVDKHSKMHGSEKSIDGFIQKMTILIDISSSCAEIVFRRFGGVVSSFLAASCGP